MLQEIRERAQGWVAWAIVIMITVPFAFWGIDSYFGGGAEPFVAKVNGTKITERAFNQTVQRTRVDLRERLGEAYDPSLFDNQRLREQVRERMISDAVLRDASMSMGLRVSDDAVRAAVLAEPFFQENGAFSNETYQRVLRQQGLSPAGFEESTRTRLLATQLPRAVTDSEFVTPSTLAESVRLMRQRRELAYITVATTEFSAAPDPDDAAINAWYETHKGEFRTPEQVRVSYLEVDAKALATPPEAQDEATLRETYDSRVTEFTTQERRHMRHILLAVPASASEADASAALDKIKAIRARITSGESFDKVATEVSEDPGSKTKGGDLGLVERGIMDPAFEEAGFALAVNTVSEPVRSRFGYHLIEVTEIQPEAVQPFEAVRAQLVAEAGAGQAEGAFYDLAERLATLAYESPDSLVPAAEGLGIDIKTTDWLSREGGTGVFANPKVIAAAFSADVLDGNNSELIEPDPELLQAVVLRVDEHREPAQRPLAEVREQIVTAIRAKAAADAALGAAKALVDRLEAGEALEAVAGERKIERPGLVGRTDAGVPAAALSLAFSLPRPADGKTRFGSVEAADGGAMIVAVTKVEEGDTATLDEATRSAEQRVLKDVLGRAANAGVQEDLQARARLDRSPLAAEAEQ